LRRIACRYYKQGDPTSCRYKNRCKFSHNPPAQPKQSHDSKIVEQAKELPRTTILRRQNIQENESEQDNSSDNDQKQKLDIDLADYTKQHPRYIQLGPVNPLPTTTIGTKRGSSSQKDNHNYGDDADFDEEELSHEKLVEKRPSEDTDHAESAPGQPMQ
jgi:hypothetical protein